MSLIFFSCLLLNTFQPTSDTTRSAFTFRFARWKRAKPALIKEETFDRVKKLPSHMQRRVWTGPLPNLVDRPRDVYKELSRHMSLWTNEQVCLWVSTEESLIEVLRNNSIDYNRCLQRCNVMGCHLANLHSIVTGSNDPLSQFLGMVDFPPYEKKQIVNAVGNVLKRQMGLAPQKYREAVEGGARVNDLLKSSLSGDRMLRREAQRQFDYHVVSIPVAIGHRAQFRLIGALDLTPLTSMEIAWDRIREDPKMSIELEKEANSKQSKGTTNKRKGEFWLCTPRDDRRLCLVSIEKSGSVAPDVSTYVPERNDDGDGPVDVNRIHQKSIRLEAQREEDERNNPTLASSGGAARRMKEEKGGADDSDKPVKLSGREIDDALQYEKMTTPIHAFAYPLLLIQPVEQEVLRGVEWTGVRQCKQWIPPNKLKQMDEAWKLAHRYKIEGFESKKRWAAESTMGLDREVAELEGKRTSPKKKSGTKKWS